MGKKLSEMSNEELWKLFPIILKEHNSEWVSLYNDEEKLICEIVGKDNVMRINHIGSTSVNGLIAKPTIDILLEIANDFDVDELLSILEQNGYRYMKEQSRSPLNLTLVKGYTENGFASKVFHLHIRHFGDWNELYFRDYLRVNKDIANQYGSLKMNLKEQYEHDRDAYTNAKSEFVLKYTDIARCEFNSRYSPTK